MYGLQIINKNLSDDLDESPGNYAEQEKGNSKRVHTIGFYYYNVIEITF